VDTSTVSQTSAKQNVILPTEARDRQLIDDKTKAVFCESVGNPAGNICDIEALAAVAHKHASSHRRQYGGDADPAQADRLRRRHRRSLADEVF